MVDADPHGKRDMGFLHYLEQIVHWWTVIIGSCVYLAAWHDTLILKYDALITEWLSKMAHYFYAVLWLMMFTWVRSRVVLPCVYTLNGSIIESASNMFFFPCMAYYSAYIVGCGQLGNTGLGASCFLRNTGLGASCFGVYLSDLSEMCFGGGQWLLGCGPWLLGWGLCIIILTRCFIGMYPRVRPYSIEEILSQKRRRDWRERR